MEILRERDAAQFDEGQVTINLNFFWRTHSHSQPKRTLSSRPAWNKQAPYSCTRSILTQT